MNDFEMTPGVLKSVPGTQAILKMDYSESVLKSYHGNAEHVVIPEEVTRIGRAALEEHRNMKSVHIPEHVTEIQGGAFFNCIGLEEITLPEHLTEISESLFYDCSSLKSIVIPDGVTRIATRAFYNCKNLINITIPESVAGIGVDAFSGTAWLKNYPDDFVIVNHILVKYQGHGEEITVPDGVTRINETAFELSHVKSVHLPESVTSIGERAFQYCDNLESINIPEHITRIGQNAFYGCNHLEKAPMLLLDDGKIIYEPEDRTGVAFFEIFRFVNGWQGTRDYTVKMNHAAKYNLLFQMFVLGIDTEGVSAYIKKNFSKMFRYLVDKEDIETIRKVLDSGKFITKRNIGKHIQYAADTGKYAVQILLNEYKKS